MAVLDILKYPAKILMEHAVPVDTVDDDLRRLIDDMAETMYAAPGVGLAAPQIGVSKRLITVDVGAMENENARLIVLVNPEIVEHEGRVESEEGCLSLPGFIVTVPRFERVSVSGLDRDGKQVLIEGEGMLSRALQHEIDHLNGTLLLDRASMLKREFFKKSIRKNAPSTKTG